GQHSPGVEHEHLNHCPMCGIAATAWTIALAQSALARIAHAGADRLYAAADAPPPAVTAWSAHRPRGPPIPL
ncbi:MAG: DUF2946 family protein, partial [Burkholderiaceae bacterium]